MIWIARLVALLLSLTLADAAVASGSGLPGMLLASAAGAGLALGGLIVFWGRPWIASALATLFVFCVFAYGSFTGSGGPPLSGLPAGDAAAAALVLGIAASVVAVWSVVRNIVVRALVAIVAIYVTIAPIASIGHGGLAASFIAAPLAVTRGSYAAGEMLFPLAALVALAGVFVYAFRKRGTEAVASLVFALALAAATQFGSYAAGAAGLPTIVAFEHPKLANAATTIANSTVARNAVVDSPSSNAISASSPAIFSPAPASTNVADAVTASPAPAANAGTTSSGDAATGARFVPKDSDAVAPDVATTVKENEDPAHALARVATLGNDVYPGALAGSAGVLRSGSGNSIDKALLLRDVLRVGSPSIETQFATCTLSDAEAEASIASAQAAKEHAKLLIQSAASAVASAKNTDTQNVLQKWSRAWTSMVSKTKSDGPKLSDSLAAAHIELAQTPIPHDRLRAVAARHVWLQAKVGGAWVDLDPTIDAATPGKTRCTAQSVTAALPDDDYDVLDVRVTEETLPNGQPLQTAVLDRSMRTVDLGDRAVSFVFAEMTGVDVPAVAAPAGAKGYTPLLFVGDENITGTPILLPVEETGGEGNASSSGFHIAAGLLNADAATPAATAVPVTIVSAIWLDLVVTSPGAATTRVRRPIFDRVGLAARAGSATQTPLAEQPAAENYTAMQTEWNVAVSAGHVASATGPSNLQPAQNAESIGNALARLNGAFYTLRRALMDEASGAPVEVVAAQPGISVVSMENDGNVVIDSASDASVPLTNADSRPLWATATLLAEREIVHNNAPVFSGLGAGPDSDALASFDQAVASDVKLQAYRSGNTTVASDTSIPSDTRTRMSGELAAGATLLALPSGTPNNGPPYAYWVVDSTAGTLRDENVDGLHVAATEYTATNKPAIRATPLWRKLGCKVVVAAILLVTQDSGLLEGTSVEAAAAKAEEPTVSAEDNAACGGP